MHDTIYFETEGVPAVCVASDTFEEAARVQAEALGLPDAARVFVRHPIQDATDEELAERAEAAFTQVVRSLAGQAT